MRLLFEWIIVAHCRRDVIAFCIKNPVMKQSSPLVAPLKSESQEHVALQMQIEGGLALVQLFQNSIAKNDNDLHRTNNHKTT